MTIAALATPSLAAIRSLPPLGGRLLLIFKCLWLALAVAAIIVLSSLALAPGTEPFILTLRIAKGAVLLLVAAILVRRRKGDPVAALLSVALLLWATTSSFNVTSGMAPIAVTVGDRLRFLLFVMALLLFPSGQWSPRWSRHIAIASAAVFGLGLAEALNLLDTRLYLPLAIGCVIAAVGALVTRYRRLANETEKLQLKWVALGLVSGLALILLGRAGAALNPLLASPGIPNALIEGAYQIGVVVIALGFLVSLLRYRLYDAEAAISRSAAYALLTLSLVATFAGTEAVIEMLGQQYFGAGIGSISGAMGAAVAAVLLSPLHERISGWAEKHFQRDLVTLKEHLPEFLAELSASSSTTRVASAILPHVIEAVHASHAALVVDGAVVGAIGIDRRKAQSWLKRWTPPQTRQSFECSKDSAFPLRMALRCPFGSIRGWLVLGPRPDGSFYGRDEMDALTAVAPPLRSALFAVREREKEKAGESARNRAVTDQIARLMQRIEDLEARVGGQEAVNAA